LLFSKLGEYFQTKQLKAQDERIKLMNEILAGMKVLKLYAWEIPFMKRLGYIRRKEIRLGYIRFLHS
jgi:ABC transporter transmembrane region